MNKGKILLICLAGLFAASCVKDNVDQPTVPTYDADIAKKFVNTSTDAVAGKLLLYVDKEYVSQLEAANGSICTGVSAIDNVAEQIGATGIHQLFNMRVNASYKRELGMDRWFTIHFPEEVNVNDAAKALAASEAVRRVEFSKVCVAPNVGEPKVVDLSMIPQTRALVTAFPNDEYFPSQWSLLNEGNRVEPKGIDAETGEKYYTYEQYDEPGFIHPNIIAGSDINVVPAWDLTKGNRSVIVAVIDQGVDFTHPDLEPNMWKNEGETAGDGIDNDGNGYIDDVYGYNFIDNPVIDIKYDKNGNQISEPVEVNPILGQDHGTHVAGTIAAVTNNGIGVAGVAGGTGNDDGVRIMTLQILGGEHNTADQDAAARAMEYAADNGAVIAQNSWGNDPGIIITDNAYKTSMSARYIAFNYFMNYKDEKTGKTNHDSLDGGIIVFAAGNESAPMAGYPGAYNEYISVTALGPDGLPALYTNYGPGCNIAAPGGELFVNQFGHAKETGGIVSTLPVDKDGVPQYGWFQGTSMATPHVSGVAALALSYAEDLGKRFTTAQFKEMLLTSVQDVNAWLLDGYGKMSTSGEMVALAPYRNQMGTGCIDAYRALTAINGPICVPVVAGQENVISVTDLIADGQTTLKVLNEITIPADVRERLGITNETIFGDKVIFNCEKTGTGVIKIALVAGGDVVGGGNAMGGMRIEKEIALISREGHSFDDKDGQLNGSNGWL